MEIDILKIIGDLSPAGAVIAVVILFLNSNKGRDKEWRDFFTTLNATNTADMQTLTDAMASLTRSVQQIAQQLDAHDKRVDDRINAARDTVTVPRKTRQQKGNNS
ncbi:MAG: hypothetical protein ACYC36_06170 [Bellilinea sp.]